MDDRSFNNQRIHGMSDVVFECVLAYIHDSRDRQSISLVCRRLCELEAQTRKHVTIALCYTTTPKQLLRRFPFVESLKLKGKPRAAMYNLIPEDWGGFATPWVEELSKSFSSLKALHFRRMIVKDEDLELLARDRGHVLQVLKLDKCSGFSTDGLLHICSSCRNLKVLFLEESQVIEKDGGWLHELAMNNTQLEALNFYMTDLSQVSFNDLELIAKRCKSLVSVKIVSLEEFSGGCFNKQSEEYASLAYPPRLCRLGLNYMSTNEMPIVYPFASRLKKLDLLYALLDTEDHCVLLQRCPNLEVLEARNVIGDRGLEVLARSCKKMKRLRIERGADEQELEDEEGVVSQRGLTAIAQGCLDLEYIAVYVSDITNAALESMGMNLKNLCDFRMVLLDKEEVITDLPLDNGIRSLLSGCNKLRRFALYLRPGGLTDVGLTYIGQHSQNIRWMLLGYLGESDSGLLGFSRGCPSLQKLEVRGCCFSENALAMAVLQLRSLRYLWVQGYRGSKTGFDLLTMARPFWNIEIIPPRKVNCGDGREMEHPAHILAYYSLAGPRTDFPPSVIPLASITQ
ncbi:putative leucine-rich repeat domain superfamily, transport inhibitor response 1 [Helianthus annuus]|nr:putative leucine-rich repeat domain superfamily, transport inhibitor response 1 [Helianthus annuus]KAJ0487535.1 putative leucine-rich repeat domain superfamily, transport inhibitor response 1 [Helianthus annuus]KAJ0661665.1 putative leucine-rich repeat domain superfamily, transport inhibitor response 1 [Helianthus annuus]